MPDDDDGDTPKGIVDPAQQRKRKRTSLKSRGRVDIAIRLRKLAQGLPVTPDPSKPTPEAD